jgi:hypothetical protein
MQHRVAFCASMHVRQNQGMWGFAATLWTEPVSAHLKCTTSTGVLTQGDILPYTHRNGFTADSTWAGSGPDAWCSSTLSASVTLPEAAQHVSIGHVASTLNNPSAHRPW